jgi:ubiquinone biosynthesis protein UbiJ
MSIRYDDITPEQEREADRDDRIERMQKRVEQLQRAVDWLSARLQELSNDLARERGGV